MLGAQVLAWRVWSLISKEVAKVATHVRKFIQGNELVNQAVPLTTVTLAVIAEKYLSV